MFSLEKIAHSPSGSFLFLAINFIAGVSLASVFYLNKKWLVLFLVLLFVLATFLIWYRRHPRWRLLISAGLFICLGILRFISAEPSNNPHHLVFYHDRVVELKGFVSAEPKSNATGQQIILQAQQLRIVGLNNKDETTVKDCVLLSLPFYPQYQYGDKLRLTCDLVAPKITSAVGLNYVRYLQKEGVWSICFNPQIFLKEEGMGDPVYYKILQFKNYLIATVNKLLPEPQASFLGGLLYGARSSIPTDLQNAFNRTGTSHIVAISGYNITIVAAALLAVLKGLRLPRKKAFGIVVAAIIFFVILTGASASVVRAGLMGLLVLLARQLGRPSQINRVLIFTALIMLLFNPRVLFFDVGFQLSFASTLGLVYISPILEKYFIRWPNQLGLKEALLATLSAIIATTPLILYSFGRFSLVAPLVNILVLPVIPCAMALGFAAIILAALFFPLGQVVAWVVWLPLTYIIKIVEWFGSLSWSSIELPLVPWWILMLIYAVLIKIIYKFYVKDILHS